MRDDRPFVAGRLRAIGKALPDNLKEDFAKTAAMVEHAIASRVKGEDGRIIFASARSGIIQVYRVGVELEPLVVWDSSPFLLPLSRLRKDYEDYGLLLIASQEARLFLVSPGSPKRWRRGPSTDEQAQEGRWSQMRFNRLREKR